MNRPKQDKEKGIQKNNQTESKIKTSFPEIINATHESKCKAKTGPKTESAKDHANASVFGVIKEWAESSPR